MPWSPWMNICDAPDRLLDGDSEQVVDLLKMSQSQVTYKLADRRVPLVAPPFVTVPLAPQIARVDFMAKRSPNKEPPPPKPKIVSKPRPKLLPVPQVKMDEQPADRWEPGPALQPPPPKARGARTTTPPRFRCRSPSRRPTGIPSSPNECSARTPRGEAGIQRDRNPIARTAADARVTSPSSSRRQRH